MQIKICSKCHKEKVVSEFYNDKKSSDGLTPWCKSCISEQGKKYRKKHQEKIKKYLKEYYLINKKILRIKQKQYTDSHKQERKAYLLRDKEQIKKKAKEYYLLHREEIINKTIKRFFKRLKTDKTFKLTVYLRNRIWGVLKGNKKSKRTLELLGCSVEFLKNHLESQFKEGMSWDNYGHGGWVVDHIRPCASFDLSKESEQRKCFNYKNLQPLWEEDNLIKGDKINYEF